MRTAIYLPTFSSPPLFTTLFAGLVMAFAFQLLLTNLGVAVGITGLGFVLKNDSSEETESSEQTVPSGSGSSGMAGQVGFAIGFGTLLTINTVLFVACFLAVKLSLVKDVAVGAILGVVIWSAYYLLLIWLSSTAVSPMVSSVVGGITSGLRGLLSAISSALKAKSVANENKSATNANPESLPDRLPDRSLISASNPAPISAPDSVTPLKQGLPSLTDAPEAVAQESSNIQTVLKGYLDNLQIPNLDLQTIQGELEGLLSGSGLVSLAGKALAGKVDRSMLMNAVSNRTDFSQQQIAQVVDLLENQWKKVFEQTEQPQAAIAEFLETASPAELTTNELNTRLNQWVFPEAIGRNAEIPVTANHLNGDKSAQVENRIQASDFKQLFKAVLSRTDLSETEAEQILRQLQLFRDRVAVEAGETGDRPAQPFSLIQLDVENYLLNAYPWQLKRKTTKPEFEQVIYDPEADPKQIQQQLEPLNRDYFVGVLKQRDDLKPSKIDRIADQLEEVRQSVLESFEAACSEAEPSRIDDPQELQQHLKTEAGMIWQKFETYLRDPEQKLTARRLQRQFKALLKQSQPKFADLEKQLPPLDRKSVENLLQARQDLTEKRVQQVADQVEKAWNSSLAVPKNAAAAAKHSVNHVSQTLTDYVQQGDWSNNLSKAPRRFASRTQAVLQDFQTNLEDYLRHTDKAELNPEDIKQDLKLLLHDPKAGLEQLGDRLTEFDRATLVALLAQRDDLTEAEANQIIDQIEAVRQQFVEQVEAMQAQIQTLIENLLEKIRSYFTSLNLPELNYEGIQTDLQKLLNLPQEGFETVEKYLHDLNHDTLTTLLSTRQDLSQFVAAQIIDRAEAVRLNVSEQIERVRQEAENRVQALKQQAQQQVEATRKTAAIAAWWLFTITLSSAMISAIAGAMAVKGLAIF